ncbi:putative acetyltransferase [Candidatus Liberibacter solanacearum]|uniref:GNAT family N-acetyltransferase n=1 Tax=Candidatus Liberibacter solanacearum TaxID=556287 RepID=UPI0038726B05
MITNLIFFPETADHDSTICAMHAEAFGPGRFVRAAMLLREQGTHDLSLSFLCADGEKIVGSVRMVPISIEKIKGYMLGPIVVHLLYRNKGIGKKLIQMAIKGARTKGSEVVVLVGDADYYTKIGFQKVPFKSLLFPVPVNPQRVMFYPIENNIVENLKGVIRCREVD